MKSAISAAPSLPAAPSKLSYNQQMYAIYGERVLEESLFSALAMIVKAIVCFHLVFFSKDSDIITTWNRIIFGPEIICLVLFFIGIHKMRSAYVAPIMVSVTADILSLVVVLGLCVYSHHHPESEIAQMIEKSFYLPRYNAKFIIASYADILLIAAFVWFLAVFRGCYRYLRDLELHNKRLRSVASKA